jgi:hypothetical protein
VTRRRERRWRSDDAFATTGGGRFETKPRNRYVSRFNFFRFASAHRFFIISEICFRPAALIGRRPDGFVES